MRRVFQFGFAVVLALASLAGTALAQSRNALVIGNSAYENAPALKTPTTDAAVVAETLRAAGYDVTELRNVRQATIGQSMRDFLDKVQAGGPDGIAFVYYSGYGAQAGGENFIVPIDAVISNDREVANESFRLNDLLEELTAMPLAARIIVLDASRDHKFGSAGGRPIPKGLAMGDTIPGTLLAFAAAPGAVAIDGDGDYSLYTGAQVTMMRQPGLDMEQIFKATRVQVNQATAGAQTPWMTSALPIDLFLFQPTAAAPEPQTTPAGAPLPPKQDRVVNKEMLRTLSPDDAYRVAIEEDSLEGYQWFVELFPQHQYAAAIWEIIETRREAVLWRRTLAQDTTRAYWNYLKRYPNGAHVAEAQDALAALSAATAPPPTYVAAPQPLPPDYYDEAVGLVEIFPEGFVAPPSVFDVLAPLFLPRPPRVFVDRPFDRRPPPIPGLRGDPVGAFTQQGGRDRDGRDRDGRDRTQQDGRDRTKKTGITQGADQRTKKTGVDGGAISGDRNKKSGVGLPEGRNPRVTRPGDAGRPTTPGRTPDAATGRPTLPGRTPDAATGRPTIPGRTPDAATGRPGLPDRTPDAATGRPTIPGRTPDAATGRPTVPGAAPDAATGRPTIPGRTPDAATGRPTIPGRTPDAATGRPTVSGAAPDAATGRPTIPGRTPDAATGRPTVPGAAPGAATGRPTVPGATPGGAGVTRPGLPPVPGAATGRPTTPTPQAPSAGQRPGLPPTAAPIGRPTPPAVTPTRPTAPGVAPTLPTPPAIAPIRPTPPAIAPTRPTPPAATPARPTPPAAAPTRPTPPAATPARPTPPAATPVRPTPPAAAPTRPAAPPAARPTPPAARPATPPAARPTPPAARPTPPAARPTPPAPRPAAPAARPAPAPRPAAPAARPAPAPRPAAPAARPAPAPRPAAPAARPAPAPRQPVCQIVNGKKVCR